MIRPRELVPAVDLHLTSSRDRDDWTIDALCAQIGDTELFYPEKGGSTKDAKAMCAQCPVRDACLRTALTEYTTATDHGIWGGTTPGQRRTLRRQRNTQQEGTAA